MRTLRTFSLDKKNIGECAVLYENFTSNPSHPKTLFVITNRTTKSMRGNVQKSNKNENKNTLASENEADNSDENITLNEIKDGQNMKGKLKISNENDDDSDDNVLTNAVNSSRNKKIETKIMRKTVDDSNEKTNDLISPTPNSVKNYDKPNTDNISVIITIKSLQLSRSNKNNLALSQAPIAIVRADGITRLSAEEIDVTLQFFNISAWRMYDILTDGLNVMHDNINETAVGGVPGVWDVRALNTLTD
jgi:hypothetical protein